MIDASQYERRITALQDLALAVTASFDLDSLLQSIVEICTKFSNASRGALFLYDTRTANLVMRAEIGNVPELRFNAKYSTNDSRGQDRVGLTVHVFRQRSTLILNSPEDIVNHPAHRGKYDDKQ